MLSVRHTRPGGEHLRRKEYTWGLRYNMAVPLIDIGPFVNEAAYDDAARASVAEQWDRAMTEAGIRHHPRPRRQSRTSLAMPLPQARWPSLQRMPVQRRHTILGHTVIHPAAGIPAWGRNAVANAR